MSGSVCTPARGACGTGWTEATLPNSVIQRPRPIGVCCPQPHHNRRWPLGGCSGVWPPPPSTRLRLRRTLAVEAIRFDAITKAWGSRPRRRLLGGLAGSALGALATALGAAETEATHFICRHVGQRCKSKSECCSSRCKHGRCRAHHVGRCTAAKDACVTGIAGCGGGSCYCERTTGGASFCSMAGGLCMACTTDAQCAVALNTPGSACIDINHGGCTCAPFTTACLPPCPK